jgi:hypothetical protein
VTTYRITYIYAGRQLAFELDAMSQGDATRQARKRVAGRIVTITPTTGATR